MSDKTKFQKIVVQKLQNSGFKTLLDQQQHLQFIQMIAATYFSNQLDQAGIVQYLGDIIKEQKQRKDITKIIKELLIQCKKNQEKLQKQAAIAQQNVAHSKQEKAVENKQGKKKLKTQNQQQQQPVMTKPSTKDTNNNNKIILEKKQGQSQAVQSQQPSLSSVTLDNKKNLKHQLQTSGKTKCRFFPFCKNPQTCEFFHPTQKCQYFPNCRYADNCLYVHEPCRFKQKCTKMNCPFAHPGKKSSNNMMQMFMKSMMMGKNPVFGNNKMIKKKRPQQQKEDDQHQQQQ